MELDLNSTKVQAILALLVVGVFVINFTLYSNLDILVEKQANDLSYLKGKLSSGTGLSVSANNAAQALAEQKAQERATALATLAVQVLPKGTPAGYGEELGVSFTEVEKSLNILAKFDDSIDHTQFSRAELDSYVKIGTSISCEYCCGAQAMVFTKEQADEINQKYEQAGRSERVNEGDRSCGCAHSYAMRGLAKYLIKNHRSEYTDDQIVEEVAKWKAVFFPGPTVEKIAAQQGILPAEKATASTGTQTSSVPQQVGGC